MFDPLPIWECSNHTSRISFEYGIPAKERYLFNVGSCPSNPHSNPHGLTTSLIHSPCKVEMLWMRD